MKKGNLWLIILVALSFSIAFFAVIHIFRVPLIVQLLVLLLPFLVSLRFGAFLGLITSAFLIIAFLYENPSSKKTWPWYFFLIIGIIAIDVIGGAIKKYRFQNRKLEALYRAAQILASMRSLEQISKEVVEILEKDIGYHHAAILWVKNDHLELAYARDYIQKAGLKIELGKGVTGTAAKEKKIMIINDVKKFEGYIPGLSDAKSELACPIKVKDEIIGVINTEDKRKNAYSIEDAKLIEAFSRVVAVAWENAMLHKKLFNEAITDPLTGLYNRRYFFKRLQEEISRAKRYGFSFGVLMFDLKNFKKVNDKHGHKTGDIVLKAFAEKLRGNLRESDIVARYGGDEFVVLLVNTGKNGILAVMERAEKIMAVTRVKPDIMLEANIGAAIYPADGTTPDELLKVADERMYLAKKSGKAFI